MNIKLIEREKLAAKRIKHLRKNPTVFEKVFKGMLKEIEEPFVFQKAYYDHCFFLIADFYIPRINTVIEINGGYHYTAESRERDAKRIKWLSSKGVNSIHIKNEEVTKLTPNTLRDMLGLERQKTKKKKKKLKDKNNLVLSFN